MKVDAYTFSAISPCMRLFEVIAKEIQALLNPDDGRVIEARETAACAAVSLALRDT
ncbi:hypothetical protein WN944_008266 [Citrus x changshan-huyou]|uniref:Uncharacterized protein n=1 Tax=Citrus x changshan-huyou TaxID=2935761 RepID=A0AAP0MML2_9ROSI